jgi:hypothetical protein
MNLIAHVIDGHRYPKHFAGNAVGFVLKIKDVLEAGLEPIAAGDHFAQGHRTLVRRGTPSICRPPSSSLSRRTMWPPQQ